MIKKVKHNLDDPLLQHLDCYEINKKVYLLLRNYKDTLDLVKYYFRCEAQIDSILLDIILDNTTDLNSYSNYFLDYKNVYALDLLSRNILDNENERLKVLSYMRENYNTDWYTSPGKVWDYNLIPIELVK